MNVPRTSLCAHITKVPLKKLPFKDAALIRQVDDDARVAFDVPEHCLPAHDEGGQAHLLISGELAHVGAHYKRAFTPPVLGIGQVEAVALDPGRCDER